MERQTKRKQKTVERAGQRRSRSYDHGVQMQQQPKYACVVCSDLHDELTLSTGHVSVHGRDGEIALSHLVRQPVHLSAGVAVDDGLGDGQSLVQIAQSLELPVLALNGDVELNRQNRDRRDSVSWEFSLEH